ncbi:MAG: gfo/Idh/MocA family oxidoreductase [Proteobacteria bacterium]|nr:MAG: gfo/Idh/MocA family oxidoreductase [Pseudomonadota bacterium]
MLSCRAPTANSKPGGSIHGATSGRRRDEKRPIRVTRPPLHAVVVPGSGIVIPAHILTPPGVAAILGPTPAGCQEVRTVTYPGSKSMSHSDLNIALVGMGVWGIKIAERLLSGGVTLDVIDLDPTARESAQRLGARSVSDQLEMAADIHGIVIATPSTSHFHLIRTLAGAGIPIFVEKPLTTNVRQARGLTRLESTPVFVMHTWLYHPGIELMSAIAANRDLGELLYLRTIRTGWTSPRKDTDTVWNLLPHDLTIARAILGYYPEPTHATAELHDGVARGMVCVFGHRPFVATEISNRYMDRRREVRLHFERGIVVLPDEKTTHIDIYRGDHRSEMDEIIHERRKFSLKPDPLECELAAFLRYLKGGPEPQSSLADGVEVVERIEKVRCLARLPDA